MNSDATFVSANTRLRKKRIGSIGAGARSSQRTNTAVKAAPTSSEPTISGELQPSELPRTSPQTIPNSPTLTSARPLRSSLPAGPRLSFSRRNASGARTRPIGTLSQKIQCHEIPLTTAPPTSGPIATARPPMPPHAPSARPRLFGGTAAERIVSVSGVTIAPPTPCAARATSRAVALGASAAAADARVKIPIPIENISLRPKRSPSAAPVRSSTAKVSVYALTVHSSWLSDAPRSSRMTGRAVVTTRLSSVTMNSATDVITNVQIVL